jgi:hypothetical protein
MCPCKDRRTAGPVEVALARDVAGLTTVVAAMRSTQLPPTRDQATEAAFPSRARNVPDPRSPTVHLSPRPDVRVTWDQGGEVVVI